VLNQFDEFGNGMWHYEVTASAIQEVLSNVMGSSDRFAGFVSATGSAGTIATGDRLKEIHPQSKVIASEALQCPTLLRCGFGGHRIEGIGDKHVPWIHNVRNTDMIVAVDDQYPMALIRLFNEPAGRAFLEKQGIDEETTSRLDLLGISSISNLLTCIKAARWFELDEHDILFTVFTDSMELYDSRLQEARRGKGEYTDRQAELDFHVSLRGQKTDNMEELDHWARRRIHNLKYYTWIEQQQKEIPELNAQWDEYKTYWPTRLGMAAEYDQRIEAFNQKVGLLQRYL
jgi:cysteine synthase A